MPIPFISDISAQSGTFAGTVNIHKDSIDGLKISRTSGASENIHIGAQAGTNISSTTFPGIIKFHGCNVGEIYTQGNQPLVLGTAATPRLTIASNGDVTIAKSTPTLKFDNLAGGGLDPILEASGSNFNIKTTSVTPLSINLSSQAATFGGALSAGVGTFESGGSDTVASFISTDARARILLQDNNDISYFGTLNGTTFMGTVDTTHANNLTLTSSGYLGVGTINPLEKLHVKYSDTAGIATVYSKGLIEDTDAQLDLLSTSDGTWGSAINFVEAAGGDANTDVWSIARKTTGGSGDSSLNFNFGTTNQHNNTARVIFSSTGDGTFSSSLNVGKSLHVGPSQSRYIFNSDTVQVAGSGTSNAGPIEWKEGTHYIPSLAYAFKVRLVTTGTGTDTGASYIVYYNNTDSAWVVRHISLANNNSNHPLLTMVTDGTGTYMAAYDNHTGTYNIRYFVESWDTGDQDMDGHAFGSDFQWQRLADTLTYPDGNVVVSSGFVSASNFRPTNIVTNKVVKFNGTQLDDSIITDNGTTVTVAGTISSGAITVTGGSNQTVIDGDTAFDLTDGSKDTLLITNDKTTSAIGAIGPSIGFGNMNSDRRTSAIGAIRTGADHDNMGLAFFTHPSDTNNETIVKQLELAHDGTATFSGDVTAIASSSHSFLTGNTNNLSTADTTGFRLHQSSYTDGRYTHRFRKRDESGGVPLYLDFSSGTANVFTNLMRFGKYTGENIDVEVNGKLKATHFYGDGSNLTGVISCNNADTVDNLHADDFLRSNATDTSSGKLTFGYSVGNLNSVGGAIGVTPFRASFQATNRPGSGNYFTGHEYTFSDTGARAQLGFGSDGQNTVPHIYARTEKWGTDTQWQSWYRLYHTGYHPEADAWTTARTVTFATGDVTGSFTIDGSADVSNVALTVANDSHTHDDRYYTETESDAKYLLNTTDELDGDLTITGNLYVTGTSKTVNVEDLNVEQGEITLNYAAGSDTSGTANGAGIRIQDGVNGNTDVTMLWDKTSGYIDFSNSVEAPGFKSLASNSFREGMSTFETSLTNNDDWENSPISIRERDTIGNSSADNKYAPNLNFHWGSRISRSLWMSAQGDLYFGEYSSAGVPGINGKLFIYNLDVTNNATIDRDIQHGSFGNNNAEFAFGQTVANKVFSYGAEFQTLNSDIQIVLGRNDGTNVSGTGGIGASSTNAFHVYDTTDIVHLFQVAQTSGNATVKGTLTCGDVTSGRIVATASGTGVHQLINASTNSTVLQLITTGDNPDHVLNLQSDHIYTGSLALHINTDTQNIYLRGAQTTVGTITPVSGYELTVSNGPGKSIHTSGAITVTTDIEIGSSGLIKQQQNTDVDSAAPEAIASVVKATHTAAFFDYVIKKGTNVRAGVVAACHDGTNVEYAETSTVDLGDTSDVTLSVDISGTLMRLIATTTSNDWSVKSLIRAI